MSATTGILLPQHLNDLKRSGLSDEQIRACGFHSEVDAGTVGKLLCWRDAAGASVLGPCLCIPFFSGHGDRLDYVRVKPDRPRSKDGKTVKYESPIGKTNRGYFPPNTRRVLLNPAHPLLLTEGEKKAAKADQDGFPCVALVGVYGWQKKRVEGPSGSKAGPRELIPDLASIPWTGRTVYIAFDSDLAYKPDVQRAEWHLSEVLRLAGADVRAVRLPVGPGGAKVGLDDFLLFQGAAALRELIDLATPVHPPTTSKPKEGSPVFTVGEKVTPDDRGNVGTVTEALPGDRYRVLFEGKDGNAERVFSSKALRSLTSKPGGPPTAGPRRVLTPFTPFPVEALPTQLHPFVRAVASAIPCDPAAVALPVLVACGAAIGAARVLEIKKSWVEPLVLWGGLVARSGSVKSPPVEHAINPLQMIDLELRQVSNKAAQDFKNEEQARKEAERKGEPRNGGALTEPPPKLRCVAQDVTIESLAVILADNPKGILVFRDELASWFNSLTRYSKADTTADWLTLFHARTLTVDRKTGDKLTVAVPNAAAWMVGTIQPKVLAKASTSEFRASGGAARLLLVMPPPRQKVWSDNDISPDVSRAYENLIRRLRRLEPVELDGRTSPVPVRFTAEARRRWGQFVNEWGQLTFQAGEEDDDLAAAFSKIEAYAARFALIHHVVTHLEGVHTHDSGAVGLNSLEAGITLARWFANETERVYSALVEDAETRRLRELAERVREAGGRMTTRELQKTNSRKYRTADAAERDLESLATAGWGLWEKCNPSTGGHTKREFVLHPTFDTSDTRLEAECPAEPPTFDTSAAGPSPIPEIEAKTDRVSELSNVGPKPPTGTTAAVMAEPAATSVEPSSTKPRARKRYRNDDRPHELRG